MTRPEGSRTTDTTITRDAELSAPRPDVLPHHKLLAARVVDRVLRAVDPLKRATEASLSRLRGPGWVWPLPRAPDGRKPTVSDGFHSLADFKAGKAPRSHRGVDVMYWCNPAKRPDFPWTTRSGRFEIPRGTMALAAGAGVVTVARQLATGWAVCIDHGDAIETAYHHLLRVVVRVGETVTAGQGVGAVGGNPNPKGYPLVHLHFDLLIGGAFVDPSTVMESWSTRVPRGD